MNKEGPFASPFCISPMVYWYKNISTEAYHYGNIYQIQNRKQFDIRLTVVSNGHHTQIHVVKMDKHSVFVFSDILVGFINVFADGVQSAMDGNYVGGDIFCRIWRFAKLATVLASNNLLIGMSIDRFLAVKSPMIFVKNGKLKCFIFGIWVSFRNLLRSVVVFIKVSKQTCHVPCNLVVKPSFYQTRYSKFECPN